MRDILFKAKSIDNGEWVEGDLIHYESGEVAILERPFSKYGYEATQISRRTMVDPNTLCQYTGLTDKDGNKIWENDVLKIARTSDSIGEYYYPPLDYPVNVVVKWDLCAWMWETIEKRKHYISFPDAWCHYEAEVIGNIFDNPELLKESEENE